MERSNISKIHIGIYHTERNNDMWLYNASMLMEQWHKHNKDNKTIDDFIFQETTFCYSFMGDMNSIGKTKNGTLWLCEPSFMNFLHYLDPNLSQTECYDSIRWERILSNFCEFNNSNHSANYSTYKTYIVSDASGYYKIGRSRDVVLRFKGLTTGNPTLRLVAIINDDVESILHSENVNKKVKGEWYRLSESDIQSIIAKY